MWVGHFFRKNNLIKYFANHVKFNVLFIIKFRPKLKNPQIQYLEK